MPDDHVLGKASAPNIIIDYFSLTCPHCANFHAAVLPQLKANWIDNGRLRFIYRHFPSDSIATRGSLLAECGAEVTTAASGDEALEALSRARPDVLVSDIGMPSMDGYDFIRRVRAGRSVVHAV